MQQGGREGRGGEREILTDFAVGIGGFSTGTEVRIPPSRSTVCYFKHNPLEPTLLSSERVFITQYPPPHPKHKHSRGANAGCYEHFPIRGAIFKRKHASLVFYIFLFFLGGGEGGQAANTEVNI